MSPPQLFPDAASWAADNFSTAPLGLDARRDRLVYSATQLALRPGASFPAVFGPRDLRCFYDLMHRPEATPEALLAAHAARTKQAMTGPDVILIVHDTTELDFTAHPAVHPDLGPIGDGRGRGFLQHNSLAVRARDGLLLGLAHQQLVLRRPAPRQTSARRQHRERESRLWAAGFAGVGPAPPGCTWVDVCDRGADVFEALDAAVRLGHHARIRACQDRCVVREVDGRREPARLMQLARGLPGQAAGVVDVTGKGGRPGRTARVRMAGDPVWVEPPRHQARRGTYAPVRVWVERIWEDDPPAGVDPLEWVLLSTLPADTPATLVCHRDWYARRWPVAEDYHQAEKTGCGEERARFQDGHALSAAVTVLSVVAVRVVQLRQVARACPDDPAARVATADEIAVVRHTTGAAVRTVSEFVRGVAMMGGYLGRRGDGPPGWKTLWRGYQRLQAMIAGMRVAEQLGPRGAETTTDDDRPNHPP